MTDDEEEELYSTIKRFEDCIALELKDGKLKNAGGGYNDYKPLFADYSKYKEMPFGIGTNSPNAGNIYTRSSKKKDSFKFRTESQNGKFESFILGEHLLPLAYLLTHLLIMSLTFRR